MQHSEEPYYNYPIITAINNNVCESLGYSQIKYSTCGDAAVLFIIWWPRSVYVLCIY